MLDPPPFCCGPPHILATSSADFAPFLILSACAALTLFPLTFPTHSQPSGATQLFISHSILPTLSPCAHQRVYTARNVRGLQLIRAEKLIWMLVRSFGGIGDVLWYEEEFISYNHINEYHRETKSLSSLSVLASYCIALNTLYICISIMGTIHRFLKNLDHLHISLISLDP